MTRASSPAAARRAEHDPARAGILFGLSAFVIWGLSPLYFRAIDAAAPLEILAHRIAWSVLVLAAIVPFLMRPAEALRRIGGARRLPVYLLTTVLVSVNWLIFIWAVNNGHIVEASLGYYINPLVNVLLGVLFLAERLNARQWGSVALAAAGVLTLAVWHGQPPWISLALAFSFGVYALIRKKGHVDPIVGTLVEVALLSPAAVGYLLWLDARGAGVFGALGVGFDVLLALSGAVTAVPMALFFFGAQRLRLSTMGLMQYLAPTLQLAIGTLLFGEAFTPAHAVAFACIWTALTVYSIDSIRQHRTSRLARTVPVVE